MEVELQGKTMNKKNQRQNLDCLHVVFYKKVKIWGSTESFLKLSDFDYSQFLTSF